MIKINPQDKKLIDQAFELRNQGKYKKAISLAKGLDNKYSDNKGVQFLFADLYYELKKYDKAARYFKRCTKLAPKSELMSISLFHSLWQMGDHDGAFKEAKRYVSIAESEEYDKLYEEIMEGIEKYKKSINEPTNKRSPED